MRLIANSFLTTSLVVSGYAEARVDPSRRRRLLRFAVGGFEPLQPDPRPRGFVQLRVHRLEVLRRPGLGEAAGGFLFRRAGGAGGDADDEGDQRHHSQRQRAGDETAPSICRGG